MTVLGTRPEIIRLSRVIPLLDEAAEHTLVHTGQNHDPLLGDIFFTELGLRRPDVELRVRGAGFGAQAGQILARVDEVMRARRPERLLILGDTDSGLAALVARRLGVPVVHVEAGNRCFDDRVPEEINRRVIDACSSLLLPYTQRSREHLLREGQRPDRVLVVGNPIGEILAAQATRIAARPILAELGLEEGRYLLATLHRAENVDEAGRLGRLLAALAAVHRRTRLPVVCALHPRTRERAAAFGLAAEPEGVRFVPPLGFLDFVRLERGARCVLSDSGTVQEETCILGVPSVTLRDVTERPETLECGSTLLAGADPERIVAAVDQVTARPPAWTAPEEYRRSGVAEAIVRLTVGRLEA